MGLVVFYCALLAAAVIVPPALNRSETLQTFLQVGGILAGIVGHFAGTALRNAPTWIKASSSVVIFLLVPAGVVGLGGLLLVVEPAWVRQFPEWTKTREILLRMPGLLNWSAAAASAAIGFGLVTPVTCLVQPKPLPAAAADDPNVKWLKISAAVAFAAALVVALVPQLPWWNIRIAAVVFAIVLVWLFAKNPQFFYRFLASGLLASWTLGRFVLVLAAKDTPWGNYALEIGERLDAAFHYSIAVVILGVLYFDFQMRRESAAKPQPT